MKLDIKFISCDYQGGNSFTRSEIDHLWEQGVTMDDWDYAIICTPHILEEETYEEEELEFVFFPHIPEHEREQYITKEYIDIKGVICKTFDLDFTKGKYQKVIKTYKRYNCIDYNLDRMLTGCCRNTWYLIEWEGEKKAIGVAYHS